MLIGVAAIAFSSCKKDEVRTILNVGTAPTLTATPTTVVLLQANANNDAVKFTYTGASFGFDAAITYFLNAFQQYVFVIINSYNKMLICVHTYAFVFSEVALIILFTSAMLITGKNFANRKNAVKKIPKVKIY